MDPRFCYQPKLGEKTGEERDLVGPPSVLIFNLSNNMHGNKSENILFFPLYIKFSYFLHSFPFYIIKLQRKIFSFPFPKLFPSLPFHFFSLSSCPFHNAFLRFLKKNVNKEQMKYQVKSWNHYSLYMQMQVSSASYISSPGRKQLTVKSIQAVQSLKQKLAKASWVKT